MRRRITPAQRRHQDYIRRQGLRTGAVYEARLRSLRRKELRRVLALCRDVQVDEVPLVLEANLNESGYLNDWWRGLWVDAGMPRAKSTARELREAKAAEDEDLWLQSLSRYATQRAGSNITIVTGTWRDSLLDTLRDIMAEDLTMGVEKLTKQLYNEYTGLLERWQCRRIAQTETMIGMADAGAVAAETLDIGFTKQWCISGLGNTRQSHEMMDGIVVDQDEPFVLEGGLMLYPHDTSMGASAGEIINCACDVIRRPK